MDYEQVKEFILGGYSPNSLFIDGFHINQGLSDQDTVVYENGSQVVIVFPGTRLGVNTTALRDIGADARIASGTETTAARWHRAERTAMAAKHHALRHNKTVHTVGHSLGGNVAMHVSDRTGIPATVVNPAVLYPTSSAHNNADYSGVTLYYSPNDPIAKNSSQIPQTTGITSKELQPHQQDFWSKGGITNWLNHHKAVKYGLEAAGVIAGAAAVVFSGGTAAPEVAALGEAALEEETIPLLSEIEEEGANIIEEEGEAPSSSLATSAMKIGAGAYAGKQTVDQTISQVDTTAKNINGVLNHHSTVNNKPVTAETSKTTTVTAEPSKTKTTTTTMASSTGGTLPSPRFTLTAYSSSGYAKTGHQSELSGASLMTNYTKKKYRKQKVRRTR